MFILSGGVPPLETGHSFICRDDSLLARESHRICHRHLVGGVPPLETGHSFICRDDSLLDELLLPAPTASSQQNFSGGVNSLPSALATSGWVTAPRQTLSPAFKAGSSFRAFR